MRRDVESYEGLQKIAKERQMAREKKEEEIANAQRAELDRKYCKIRRVMKDVSFQQSCVRKKLYTIVVRSYFYYNVDISPYCCHRDQAMSNRL